MLRAENVEKHFGELKAVAGVSFDVYAEECFGILGPNGAGKSTLITCLYGASSRDAGRLSIFELDPQINGRRLRARMGIVPQDNCLDESMNVYENMMHFAAFVGVKRAERMNRVDTLLKFMSIDHKKEATVKQLSGGMQRRLVFARALLSEPELIILDEPTTGLDPAVRHLIWQKITELKLRSGTTILTTHYMDEAERLCDRLMIMDKGKIAALGSPSSLIREHCPGYVASFDLHTELADKIKSKLASSAEFKIIEDQTGIHIRAPQIESLVQLGKDLQAEARLIRPSNLEDVFLTITGKDLSADA
ncbi:MAG: ABC transporter [Deltaproteobacteria bacterium CG11_big_fil_rev_8_21_14_0_20_45_16]|nr:MAG: ABC transporter [Deltaproteobacteria bacterium CG11_big_fil_rev_8_21_14_0_20_45_16]